MYTPAHFRQERAVSLSFAAARGFGLLCAFDGTRPVASALPFCLENSEGAAPQALFHLARGNPLLALADGRPFLLAVSGDDAYVSADWYASRDQVPTFLYQSVHLTGPVRRMSESELAQQVDILSARFEKRLAPKPPWTSGKMTPSRLAAMKEQIAGLVMTIEDVEGSFKLNQHKSAADRVAVAQALSGREEPGSKAIAQAMQKP
ncbi:MAG: FMN-binding negative transcriptional regulator [Alphaproteobacteria bacterium]|nr:FMN-binding negative transcriptional regulator [Alphaproteobacteria bacterium]